MFPGEKVNHNAICSNCSKDCGNSKHDWLHKKELAFCSETKIWWLAFVEGKGMFCLLCKQTWLSESRKQVYCVEQNPSNPVEACHIKGTCWHTLILSQSPWKEKATTPRRNLQGDAAKNLIVSNATRWRKVLWWWTAGKGIYHLLLRSKRVDGKQQSIATS